MNTFATAYAFKKVLSLYKNALSATKEEIVSGYLIEGDADEKSINIRDLTSKEEGAYRVNFGGAWANIYYDGKSHAAMYSKSTSSSKEEYSLINKDELILAACAQKKDKLSYAQIVERLEEQYPGVTKALGLEITPGKTMRSVTGERAPTLEHAISMIEDDFYAEKLGNALRIANMKASSPMRTYGILKKIEKELSEMEVFVSEICKNTFHENIFFNMSETTAISADPEKLLDCVNSNKFMGLIKHKEGGISSKASYTVKWAGFVSDLTGELSIEVQAVLDLAHQRSANRTNSVTEFFKSSDSEEAHTPSRLNL